MFYKKSLLFIILVILIFNIDYLYTAGYSEASGDDFSLQFSSKTTLHRSYVGFELQNSGNYCYTISGRTFKEVKGSFSAEKIKKIKKVFLEEYKFFRIPKHLKIKNSIKDSSTSYLTITYKGVTHRIGGYAVDYIKKYSKVFNYVYKLIDEIKKTNSKKDE